jgi:hypothetical protein
LESGAGWKKRTICGGFTPCSTSAAAARRTMPSNWIVQGTDPQGADFSLVGGK